MCFRILGIGVWTFFLFVSGFGIAHSLSKHTKSVFYQNRMKKMLPLCLLVGVFGLSLDILHHEVDWVNFVPKLLCLNNWYIYTISIYYLLSPLILKVMKWKAWVLPTMVLFLSLLFSLFSLFQPLSESDNFMINKLPWVWDRLFVYLIGIYCYLKKPHNSLTLYFIGGIFFVLVLLAQYQVFPIAHCCLQVLAFSIPFVCYSLSLLCKISRAIENTLSFFGRHSLSIFLFHLIIYSFLESHMLLIPNNSFRLFVEILCVIILAPSIDWVINKFIAISIVNHEK